MSKIKFMLYETEVEILESLSDSQNLLSLDFGKELDGFVRIGERAARLSGGKCDFDLRLLENGDYTPELILKNERIPLPLIRKFGSGVICCDCTESYIRSVSQRERELEKRVSALENKLRETEEKVYGPLII